MACPLHVYGITVDSSKSKPTALSQRDTFSLHLRCKAWLGMKAEYQDIPFNPDDMFRACHARQGYNKIHKKISIFVDLSRNTVIEQTEQSTSSARDLELRPTTSEIFQKCPRFRILVIGKSGIGKSSLINHIFKVKKTIVAHEKPGEASIDHEFISPENERLVLHDSKGFEPGEEDNLKIVQDFIERRRKMPAMEHQLHAVWLCFEIPCASGRLLETGTEDFLKSKHSGMLGNVPVIAILTKYDMLIDRVERNLDEASLDGLDDEAIKELAKQQADAEVQDSCIGPLKQFAGAGIPHATTSTKEDYKETLNRLIKITESCVGQHSTPEAAVMTSIAQRVDPGLKIKASIEVGKKRYWKALMSCPRFRNRKMWDCLYVLHTDIVDVWNFYDPHLYLHSQEFREMMMKMIDTIQAGPTPNLKKTMTSGLSMLGTIAGMMSGPVAPIVVPIAAGVVLATWVYEVYQISHAVLQRFMSYIIHLTLVLQTLYLVSDGQGLTRRAIKLVVASYLASPMSGEVRIRIQDYDMQLTILELADRDTLDKIAEVMQFYSIDETQMSKLREKPTVDLSLDEAW
ncbi:uncharacterized protein F5891DRAFT_1283179 [Suillus fuscotomentosus]|uniref:G domain-containing protein n=1 Tax=Suillus fuscotomentosus TaxID=1912939 RepID=A0AAD4HCE0_9AGAM|nr:uncharacterized protein F5891DRAFT_1283179 [Suillus fuscotomentosus]KAG1887917.1 hypothetical protein F5891DRAFT_1283179 [Suillus fuscotomentosus]